jgi:hypothetical protein
MVIQDALISMKRAVAKSCPNTRLELMALFEERKSNERVNNIAAKDIFIW